MRFEVRRNEHYLRTILILAAAFTLFSVLAYVIGGASVGGLLLIISGVFLIYMAVDQGKIGWYYEIGETSLTIRRTFKRYTISGNTIEKVTTGGWPAVWERVRRYRKGTIPGSSERPIIALGRLVGFSAVSIPIRGSQPRGTEKFVLVHLKSGREYVLSPIGPDLFVKECQRLISRSRSQT